MESLPSRLKTLRGKQTQAEFADAVGISMRSLSRYENALILPDLETIIKISAKTGVRPQWLIFGEGPKGMSDAGDAPPSDEGGARTEGLERQIQELEKQVVELEREKESLERHSKLLAEENKFVWEVRHSRDRDVEEQRKDLDAYRKTIDGLMRHIQTLTAHTGFSTTDAPASASDAPSTYLSNDK